MHVCVHTVFFSCLNDAAQHMGFVSMTKYLDKIITIPAVI